MISKKNYFNLLIIMMLVTTFLPIVSFNLPWKFGSFHLYAILFAISILLFETRIFVQKSILVTLFVGLLFTLVFPLTIWQHMSVWNRDGQTNEYYSIVMALITHHYFIVTKDYKSYQRIIKITFVFLILTALTSINASFLNPMYARHLTGTDEAIFSVEDRNFFLRIGGGAYGFATAIVALIPLIIYLYRSPQITLINRRYLRISFLIVLFAIIRMQIFANLLMGFLMILLSIQRTSRLKQAALYIVFVLFLLILVPKQVYYDAFMNSSDLFDPRSNLHFKLVDMAMFFGGSSIEETAAGYRFSRYPDLLYAFLESPILGVSFLEDSSYNQAGGHLFWMNRLATNGIFGLFLFITVFTINFKKSIRQFQLEKFKVYYYLSITSILGLGLVKNLAGRETWFMIFLIIPGFYYFQDFQKLDKLKYHN